MTMIALLGLIASFCLFLDNIDVILDEKVNKRYKIVKTSCIVYVILLILYYYIETL